MMNKMKTNNKPSGPDLDSIINGLNIGSKTLEPPKQDSREVGNNSENNNVGHEGRLWNEFMDILNDDEEIEESRNTKLYAIDDDIVETLHQCDFDGRPNVAVINSILRAFLIDNINRLRQRYRPRSASLLDKY